MGANASTAHDGDTAEEQLRSGGPNDYYQREYWISQGRSGKSLPLAFRYSVLGVEVEATSEEIRKAYAFPPGCMVSIDHVFC